MNNTNEHWAIAIDGPSGAGKSSMAKELAKRFNFIYADTGAIYRTLGLAALRENIDRKSSEECMKLLPTLEISLGYNNAGEQRMYLNGEDVSAAIRQPEVSVAASDVSAHAEVRKYLLEMQRKLARENNVIMDGRDIGTVVLPDAQIKIFLTADAKARAERRLKELETKNIKTTFEEVLNDILYRDTQDSNRAAAPLRKAEDAIELDTSRLDFDKSFERLCSIVEKRLRDGEEGK